MAEEKDAGLGARCEGGSWRGQQGLDHEEPCGVLSGERSVPHYSRSLARLKLEGVSLKLGFLWGSQEVMVATCRW